jgi:hypothetical protein
MHIYDGKYLTTSEEGMKADRTLGKSLRISEKNELTEYENFI